MVKRLLELCGSLRQMAGVVDPHKAFREAIEGTARRVEDRGSELLTGYKPMHSAGLDGERLNVLARTLGLIGPDRCIVEGGDTASDGDDRPSRWVRVHHPDPSVLPAEVVTWTPTGAHVPSAAVARIVDFLRAWAAKAAPVRAFPTVVLTADQEAILAVLSKTPTKCRTVNDVASVGTIRNRETVGRLLRELARFGLVDRPHGTRKGYALTDAGRKRLPGATPT
ncbi:MAG TPA: hypothetical protein PLU35_14675 [Phycisphaerales bacterium]|nr:hypothetical protein [Phycisphaerales bacterium]